MNCEKENPDKKENLQRKIRQEQKLRLNEKKFGDEEVPHELFLTTRQTTKLRNTFAINMPTDIKRNKAQICKII